MSRQGVARRDFLTLPLGLLLSPLMSPLARALAAVEGYSAPFRVEVSLFYGALTNRIESPGARRRGRWAPLRSKSFFSVKGRESRADVTYDYAARQAEYHFKG